MYSVNQLHLALTLALLTLNVAVASYTSTQCYAWYHKAGVRKDGIVASKAKLLRPEHLASAQKNVLVRRITPTQPSKWVAGGTKSACSKDGYVSSKVDGVCLWSGAGSQYSDKLSGGWVTGSDPTNCNKKVYLIGNNNQPYYGTVVDACGLDTTNAEDGCSTIWVTEHLFDQLPGDGSHGHKTIKTWDFDSSTPAH